MSSKNKKVTVKCHSGPNNTITPTVTQGFRGRRFHLVLNPGETPDKIPKHFYLMFKYTKLIKYLLHIPNFRYLISGYGLPEGEENPNIHIHIYVEYTEPTRLYISKVYGAHIETRIDNSSGLINYVKSQELGTIEEIGRAARGNNLTINEAEKLSINELKDLNIQYTNIVNKIILSRQKTKLDNYSKFDKLKVFYIFGPSGVGKSRKAIDLLKQFKYDEFDELKHENGFYIGDVTGEGACLYDDFRPTDMKVKEFINFIDYNVHTMNIKGGYIKNNYHLIIITSINDPNTIYSNCIDNEETSKQWIRRLTIIQL